ALRLAGEPRGRRAAAGELQLVSILPRLGTELRRTREEAILVKRVAVGLPGARRLHAQTSSQRALCSLSAGATPVIRAEGFFHVARPSRDPSPAGSYRRCARVVFPRTRDGPRDGGLPRPEGVYGAGRPPAGRNERAGR